MDGIYAQDEEQRLCLIAQSYSICENSIAVLSNLRTGKSHIFFGTKHHSNSGFRMGRRDLQPDSSGRLEKAMSARINFFP